MSALARIVAQHRRKLAERHARLVELAHFAGRLRAECGRVDADLAMPQERAGRAQALAAAELLRGRRDKLRRTLADIEGEIAGTEADIAVTLDELRRYEQLLHNQQSRARGQRRGGRPGAAATPAPDGC